jgi:hypothetical protein
MFTSLYMAVKFGHLNKGMDIRRLKTAEMKFMRHTTEYSLLDHRKIDIFEELKVHPVGKEIA